MINPIFNQQILEAILRQPMPKGTPPFNPNAGTAPQIGPTMPGQVRQGMLNRTSPVDLDTILGFDSAIPPIQGPGMAGMSPNEPGYGSTPTAPWSGYETANKRQDLNKQGLEEEYRKLQEAIKKPRAKANMKQTFGKQDLPIALIGGLLAWLAGGRNRGKSVSQFVQSFAGFNKQRADEQNQAEMQRVEEENRAAELEIASQKIGIDLKKLDYDQQEQVLERYRAEEKRTQALEDYAKKVEIDLGADLKRIGVTQSGKLQLKDTEELRKTLSNLQDPGKRQEAMNDYYAYMASDGSMSIEEAKLLSERFLGNNTVGQAKDIAGTDLSVARAGLSRTREDEIKRNSDVKQALLERGLDIKDITLQALTTKFKYLETKELLDIAQSREYILDMKSRRGSREYQDLLDSIRLGDARGREANDMLRLNVDTHRRAVTELSVENSKAAKDLEELKLNTSGAKKALGAITDRDVRAREEARIKGDEALIERVEREIKERSAQIKGHADSLAETTKQIEEVRKDLGIGGDIPRPPSSGGGDGKPGRFTPYVTKQTEKLKAEGWGRPEQFGPGSVEGSTHPTGEGLDIRGGNGKTLEQAFERMKKTDFNYLIFRGREYKRDAKGAWKDVGAYTGPNPHNDHVHGDYNGKAPYVAPKPNSPKNPNLSKVAAGLGMGAIGGLVKAKKKEAPKPKGRVIKVNGIDVEVNEK